MTSKERLLTVLSGGVPDRIPIYTQIPFGLDSDSFIPAPFHGYDDYDSWRSGDPAYTRLVRRMEKECDNFFIWRPPCMESDQFFFSPGNVRSSSRSLDEGKIEMTSVFNSEGFELRQKKIVQPGSGHTWQTEHYCKTSEDAARLLDLPWKGNPAAIGDFFGLEEQLGERGVIWVTVPSPLLVVTRLFDPQDFLIFSQIEDALVHSLLRTARDRIMSNLRVLLDKGAGPVVRFGGAEHATPPLMSPANFDAFLVQYDMPLVKMCKDAGRFVAYHCHGHIKHALKRFREMGVDQTDPVESIPDGDITLAEAAEIAGGRITLTGNIQSREMNMAEPGYIRGRVKEIIEVLGPGRLVITTTGTPLESISPSLEKNYNALIDAVLE